MRYVVETRMGNVWEAVWSEDQEPMIFDSEEEAEVEIAETLEDLQEAYELGDMSSPMTRDEFRIVPFEDRFAALCEEYAAWCADQGLPCIDVRDDVDPRDASKGADTHDEARAAWAKGHRTFRVITGLADLDHANEILCPASKEAGARTTCAACRLCGGTSTKSPKSIAIPMH
jgi:hypothetical protein